MTRLTTSEAASLFGVDVATIRRRIRTGVLTAQKDSAGRYRVALPEDAAYLAYLKALLAEVRRQRSSLERQVDSQRRELEQNMAERAELEDLVISLRGPGLLPERPVAAGPTVGPVLENGAVPARAAGIAPGWAALGQRGEKKDLGASLVLTGTVAMAAGLLLHLALRTHAIDSAVHLGYIVGLVGLLLLLIGLVLVY